MSEVRELERIRRELLRLESTIKAAFVQGRLRTDRDAPTAANNVLDGDRLGDIYRDGDLEAVLVDTGSGLAWRFKKLSAVVPMAYTPSNVSEDRTFDADSTSTAEIADILGTLLSDLGY